MNTQTIRRLGALVATAAVAAGCGTSGTHSNTSPSASQSAARLSATGAGSAHAAPSAVSRSKAPVITAGPLLATVSGTGSQAIDALTEKTGVVLEWRTASPPMQIFNGHGFLLVVSNLSSGRVRLAKGHYGDLHVGAKGPWTIQVHASA
jgi:hypothetical protein